MIVAFILRYHYACSYWFVFWWIFLLICRWNDCCCFRYRKTCATAIDVRALIVHVHNLLLIAARVPLWLSLFVRISRLINRTNAERYVCSMQRPINCIKWIKDSNFLTIFILFISCRLGVLCLVLITFFVPIFSRLSAFVSYNWSIARWSQSEWL